MSASKKPNRYALDVSRFLDSPSYELAVLVHQETEAQRTIEARAFREKHGEWPQPPNALRGLLNTEPSDRSGYKQWDEYAMSFEVLLRCREALGGSLGDVAKRIVVELEPEPWEAMFWMANWLQALDDAGNVKAQMAEQTQAIERVKRERSKAAADAAKASHAKYAEAEAYVLQEWALHKDKFKGNRTAFAKNYVEVILSKFDHVVAMKTIHATWLKGR